MPVCRSLRSVEEVTVGSSPEAVEAVTVGSSLGAVTVGWSLQGDSRSEVVF